MLKGVFRNARILCEFSDMDTTYRTRRRFIDNSNFCQIIATNIAEESCKQTSDMGCYIDYLTEVVNWFTARKVCEAQGTHLWALGEENDADAEITANQGTERIFLNP